MPRGVSARYARELRPGAPPVPPCGVARAAPFFLFSSTFASIPIAIASAPPSSLPPYPHICLCIIPPPHFVCLRCARALFATEVVGGWPSSPSPTRSTRKRPLELLPITTNTTKKHFRYLSWTSFDSGRSGSRRRVPVASRQSPAPKKQPDPSLFWGCLGILRPFHSRRMMSSWWASVSLGRWLTKVLVSRDTCCYTTPESLSRKGKDCGRE